MNCHLILGMSAVLVNVSTQYVKHARHNIHIFINSCKYVIFYLVIVPRTYYCLPNLLLFAELFIIILVDGGNVGGIVGGIITSSIAYNNYSETSQ